MKPQGIGLVPAFKRYKANGYLYADGLGILPYYVVWYITTQHPARRLIFCSLAIGKGPAKKCEWHLVHSPKKWTESGIARHRRLSPESWRAARQE